MATTTHTLDTRSTCDPATRVTKSLLGYGVLAGPFYVSVALAQAFTRDGFHPSVHQWSMLAIGEHGWIQVANLALTGLMLVAFAVGLRRALTPGRGARWAPRLVATYGISMVAAAAFPADAAYGFPVGTPDGPGQVSWHGMLHLLAGSIGFTALAVACFVMARRYAADGRRGWAVGSRIVGIAFLAGFGAVAAGAGAAAANLAFTAAVVTVFGWVAAVAVDQYRSADTPS
ncbi:DUF998 domain-containing protein [Mumia zhuanghuii]|uniref:DUF998 domain-containing protein n=2 Tax=Mumia TaxID=1546255 RepID=A0ABW1QJA2_9ACTN|nr:MULTISPECIES: DUF998 domain-containing protein [Mumia]KAA1424698.1 DUF998 domain-containing protein [Mumia zhuanghuii]